MNFSEQGPSILVQFHLQGDSLVRVSLQPSEQGRLCWEITGDACHDEISDWMLAYSCRRPKPFPLPLSLNGLPPFTMAALEKLAEIPFGKTLSYGELAVLTGNPRASRAVGQVCGKNPFPLIIPCHRVLAAKGKIGGFTPGIEVKRRLLRFEQKSTCPLLA